jgi:Ca2+/Na+ antiporter
MKKPDLLVLIAIWQFITAFIAFVGIAAIAIFAFPAVLGYWDGYGYGMMRGNYDMPVWGGVFGLSIAILVLLCYLALAVAGGIGLLINKGHEWARIVSIVHSALSLFVVPIGTVIGTLSIIYLTKQEVKDYFSPPHPAA